MEIEKSKINFFVNNTVPEIKNIYTIRSRQNRLKSFKAMKYLFWAHLGKEITKFGFYLTSFSATLFIILTLFYVKEKIGSYRYLLLLLPITGFLLASFEYMLDLVSALYRYLSETRYVEKHDCLTVCALPFSLSLSSKHLQLLSPQPETLSNNCQLTKYAPWNFTYFTIWHLFDIIFPWGDTSV